MSSIRQENPHSLSYQPKTRSNLPSDTDVSRPLMITDSSRARRSDDTNGRSVQPNMFVYGPFSDAPRSRAFTPSAVTGSRVCTTRSIHDTLAVGTRIARD